MRHRNRNGSSHTILLKSLIFASNVKDLTNTQIFQILAFNRSSLRGRHANNNYGSIIIDIYWPLNTLPLQSSYAEGTRSSWRDEPMSFPRLLALKLVPPKRQEDPRIKAHSCNGDRASKLTSYQHHIKLT